MKQKIRRGVTIVLSSFLGVYIGHALFLWWDVKKNPGLYAMSSAPWYTQLYVEGAALAAVFLLGGLVWLLSGRIGKSRTEKKQ